MDRGIQRTSGEPVKLLAYDEVILAAIGITRGLKFLHRYVGIGHFDAELKQAFVKPGGRIQSVNVVIGDLGASLPLWDLKSQERFVWTPLVCDPSYKAGQWLTHPQLTFDKACQRFALRLPLSDRPCLEFVELELIKIAVSICVHHCGKALLPRGSPLPQILVDGIP
uniref:Protein kinase domain-containing protein n=1 Tax=Chromera velia CCMP2878 TaxID=1169474 RepID=A0A0G4FF40_9ALVE|eukprot:Cvel_16633.t1-p1 / transcript=Cvel_16633.t1 / gene=Cvel_16633 / organism=Chromera_velia_CCMP2878 / gene_product=hypothetical protein / transcript_product=hypothetical protein / location=Cvel_scaffold1289:34357-42671(-) / protein_length=166 / sequence_SO=supercontig / SO=protein_coding / is_pseudo=false